MKKLVVIVGPTAAGKTALSIWLARKLETEIISADSRQVYRELNIGTSKPSSDELALIPHHFINIKSVTEQYNAGLFGSSAIERITSLFTKYKYVIVCGGSGLYIRSLIEGFDEMPDIPEDIRNQLRESYQNKGLSWLQKQVSTLDAQYYMQADKYNSHRLLRALEILKVGQRPISHWYKKKRSVHPFAICKVGLTLPRQILYEQINTRVDRMYQDGLLEETKKLFHYRHLPTMQTVGYEEMIQHIQDQCSLEQAISKIKQNTRRYAKRQLTWFGRDPQIKWFSPYQESSILNYVMDCG